MKKLSLSLATVVMVGLVGCGSSDSTDTVSGLTENTSTSYSGQLVDSYVKNVHFKCADGKEGETDINGNFSCDTLPVDFSVGGVRLGSINELNSDKQVFPQDLVGVDRNDTNDSNVVAMAQFLQSCDIDHNTSNGIEIDDNVTTTLTDLDEDFDATRLGTYVAEVEAQNVVHENNAVAHLEETTDFVSSVHETTLPTSVKDSMLSVLSTLDENTTHYLTYMGDEENLAYDIYMELNTTYPDVKQFANIATKSEVKHIETIKLLLNKYDINTTLSSDTQQPGVYEIEAIQNLYNALLAKGQGSQTAALEVGCMVEVTDINDLDIALDFASKIDAPDVTAAFDFLHEGSYSHYWAFDSGLKSQGVSDGCCSLGVIDGVDYCHNEYPKNESEGGSEDSHETTGEGSTNDNGERKGDGSGEGQQKGKH